MQDYKGPSRDDMDEIWLFYGFKTNPWDKQGLTSEDLGKIKDLTSKLDEARKKTLEYHPDLKIIIRMHQITGACNGDYQVFLNFGKNNLNDLQQKRLRSAGDYFVSITGAPIFLKETREKYE